MAHTSTRQVGIDTSHQTAAVAPDNKLVTAQARAQGATLKPGGVLGAPVDVGMTELHGEDVPSHLLDLVEHQDIAHRARG
jgi:hypothetical protein